MCCICQLEGDDANADISMTLTLFLQSCTEDCLAPPWSNNQSSPLIKCYEILAFPVFFCGHIHTVAAVMKIAAFPVFFGGHIHTVAAVMKIAGHELLNMTPRKGRQEYAVALREAN